MSSFRSWPVMAVRTDLSCLFFIAQRYLLFTSQKFLSVEILRDFVLSRKK